MQYFVIKRENTLDPIGRVHRRSETRAIRLTGSTIYC